MSNKTIGLIIGLFFVAVGAMFVFSFVFKEKAIETTVVEDIDSVPAPSYGITRIEGKHFFIDGVHTIVGELIMPTPCDLLNTSSAVRESNPEQVSFNFTVINTTDFCEQKPTAQRFLVAATASERAELNATFMGLLVELNLHEAEPDESPESFELFIKG